MKKPFKVGDRVAVYDRCRRGCGVITAVNPDGNMQVRCGKYDDSDNRLYDIHPKQCRRLIKKKRREIWIMPSTLFYINNPKYGFYDRPISGVEMVLFIEAKKK